MAIAGIARPQPFFDYLKKTFQVECITFSDHHFFTDVDLQQISSKFHQIKTENKIIVTTEKDAMRIKHLDIEPALKEIFYFLPVEVKILFNEQPSFESIIEKYISKDQGMW